MIDDNCVELQRKITKLEQQLQSDKLRHAADLAAQEELIRHEKLALLAQVADIVGHELRNPLGVINNAVYFLQTVLAEADATVKEYLGIISGEIAEAERIVSDLLDAVRTKPPQTDIVDVAALIAQTLPRCEIPADVDVRQHIPETLSAIRVDPAQMQQVLWNLVTNAVEAMPQGGLLEITASEDKQAHSVRIDIRDSGAGIAPEQQNRLFQPLFTTKTRRIGLGLAVVKNLTQANGGKVAVYSESGKGATFTIILPAGSE